MVGAAAINRLCDAFGFEVRLKVEGTDEHIEHRPPVVDNAAGAQPASAREALVRVTAELTSE